MKKLFLIIFLFLFLVPAFVSAQGLVPCGPGTEKETCQFCDFFTLINNILVEAFKIIGVIAAVMAIVGGVFFFFAGTSPNALRRAKGIIISVVIGVVIILAAWAIVNTIFENSGVVKKEIDGRAWQWWDIQCTY